MTKLHEEVFRTTIQGAMDRYAETPPKGEFVLVVAGAQKESAPEVTLADALARMEVLMKDGLSRKDAARQAAQETGFPKNELYNASME